MANEFVISEIIEEKVFSDLNKLIVTLDNLKSTMVGLAKESAKISSELGKGLSFNPSNLDELYKKTESYKSQSKQLDEMQKKLSDTQKKYNDVLKKVNTQVSESVKEAKAQLDLDIKRAKLVQQQEKAEQSKYQTLIKEAQAQKAVDSATKSRTVSESQITEALNTQARSVKEAQVQNRALRQAVRELDQTTEGASQKIDSYNKKILENEQFIDKSIDSMTARKRNIGNYSSAFNGLNMSVQQVVRELPSVAYGINMFFGAISNNLPILSDEIARARQELKLLNEQGMKGTPVWKQVASSLLSWQTAMIAGITILTMYGDDIIDWVSNLFKGKKGADELEKSMKRLNSAISSAYGNASEEVRSLDKLNDALNNAKKGSEEWKSIKSEIIAGYSKYLPSLDSEIEKTGSLASSYDKLTQSIQKSAAARSFELAMGEEDEEYFKYRNEKLEEAYDALIDTYGEEQGRKLYQEYLKLLDSGNAISQEMQEVFYQADAGWLETANSILFDIRERQKARDEAMQKYKDIFGVSQDQVAEDSIKALRDSISLKREELEKLSTSSNEYKQLKSQIEEEEKKLSSILGESVEGGFDIVQYMQEIEDQITQATLEAISNRKNREIAQITLEYDERINAIKGNSEKEIELRGMLEAEKADKIMQVSIESERSLQEANLNNMLSYVKKGSEEELAYRIRLLGIQRERELEEAEKTGVDQLSVNRKYDRMIQEEKEKFASKIAGNMYSSASAVSIIDTRNLNEQMRELSQAYKDGNISREEYEAENYRIQQEYAEKQLRLQIGTIKKILDMGDLSDEDRSKYLQNLAEAEMQLDNMVTDNKIRNDRREVESEKEKREKIMELMQEFSQLLSDIGSLGDQLFENKIEQLEKESEANQESYDNEIERIENLAETGAISTEEAEARKRAAEDRTRAKEEEIAKKKALLQEKQAKFDKMTSIAQTIINISQSIMKTVAQLGYPAAIPFVALAAAQGAIQLATIMATPIPKYKEGTKSHKGGFAIVGDGMKPETVITPDSKVFITPDYPVLVDLPKGSKVIPDDILDIDPKIPSEIVTLSNMRDEYGLPAINVNNDYGALEKQIKALRKDFIKAFGRMEKSSREAIFEQYKRNI